MRSINVALMTFHQSQLTLTVGFNSCILLKLEFYVQERYAELAKLPILHDCMYIMGYGRGMSGACLRGRIYCTPPPFFQQKKYILVEKMHAILIFKNILPKLSRPLILFTPQPEILYPPFNVALTQSRLLGYYMTTWLSIPCH